jgi:hypothetical protein
VGIVSSLSKPQSGQIIIDCSVSVFSILYCSSSQQDLPLPFVHDLSFSQDCSGEIQSST